MIHANAQPRVEIPYDPDIELRKIAATYLGDADLWPDILAANGVADFADLQSGKLLKLPVDEITAARSAISSSLEKIQKANEVGAQLFAFDEINKAIERHDDALSAEKKREWSNALAYAVEAGGTAETAFDIAERNRDQEAEARLSDRQGWVEGKRSEQLGWEDRELNATLIEQEKIRTLSRSTAQITFRDAGRLRLNANSHAVIQQMRVDPLKRRESAKVSLVEGDFYALLGGNSGRKALNVDVPDVNANIDSGDFWVRQDVSGAKFTNYDDDRVAISAAGEDVSLGRNEGVIIRSGKSPEGIVDLLDAPVLSLPANDGILFNEVAELSWQAVNGASGYWLEVGRDPNFNEMVTSANALTDNRHNLQNLEAGDYFWRVSAIDQFGLPGSRSLAKRFSMRIDRHPPFLRLEEPRAEKVYRRAEITVTGESEPGAVVRVKDKTAAVSGDGRFELKVGLIPGPNALEFIAFDKAGNTTSLKVEVSYVPDRDIKVMFNKAMPSVSARHFIANSEEITVTGATVSNSLLKIFGESGALRAEATTGSSGRFTFLLRLGAERETFRVDVETLSGHTSSETFQVSVDQSAPEISLEAPLPRLTSVEWLPVRALVTNADRVQLNGRDIPLSQEQFDEVVTLVDGKNTIEMTARDKAGNLVVESWQVVLDQTPPVLVEHKIVPGKAGKVAIEVRAEDQNGLAKAAPVTVAVGTEQVEGFLRYNKLSRSYRGAISVASAGAAALKDVELMDDAGNRIRIRIK